MILSDLIYQPATGLESSHLAETIYSFTCRQKQLPKEVILKDYDYERPSLDVSGIATVDSNGRGVSHVYGHYFKTPEEGDRLANIFAEQMLSEKQKFYGESTVPYMSPGYTFNLTSHFNDTYNQEYLITEITHKGSQAGCLNPVVIGGLNKDAFSIDDQVAYQNTFTAIPAITQFRPEKLTERPRISGTLHAKIDAEGDGEYAEMDEHGRYKVRLPFDVNDQNLSGRASTFIRMMQPYAGENKGMQFPLTKGTEVMLTFTDGHPDRPLIAGAVNNFETPGPVNADNQSESVIQTGGGNRIRMEDKKGSERLIMESPHSDSWIRVGAHNDPVTLNGPATVYVPIDGTYYEQGAYSLVDGGDADADKNQLTAPTKITKPDGTVISSPNANTPANWIDTGTTGDWIFEYSHGTDKRTRTIKVWESETLTDAFPGDGIRIRTSSDLYLESNARTGDYTVLRNNDSTSLGLSNNTQYGVDIPSSYTGTGEEYRAYNGNLLDKFTEGGYAPRNNLSHITGSAVVSNFSETAGSFKALLEHANVEISSVDTIKTQEGNIYDFGGYWNYDLGNSFTEAHINQSVELNKCNEFFWPKSSGTSIDDVSEVQNTAGTVAGVFGGLALMTALGASMTASSQNGAGVSLPGAAMAIGGILAVGVVATGLSAWITSGESFQGNIGNVINSPGSDKNIETWAKKVGSSFVKGSTTEQKAKPSLDYTDPDGSTVYESPMNTDTTWVSKEYGDSYGFNRGNDISVRVGHTEDHQHGNSYEYKYGGVHEETKYNGAGKKVHWERGGGGKKYDITWSHLTGAIRSFEFHEKSSFSYEGNFVDSPTLKISTNVSTLRGNVDVSAAAVDINASLATGVKLNIEGNVGITVNLSSKRGAEATLDDVTGWSGFKTFGLQAQKEAALQAKKEELVIKAMTTAIEQKGVVLAKKGVEADSSDLAVKMGVVFQGL